MAMNTGDKPGLIIKDGSPKAILLKTTVETIKTLITSTAQVLSPRWKETHYEAQLQYNFDWPGLFDSEWTTGIDYRNATANTENHVYGRNEDDDDYNILGGYLQGKFKLEPTLDLFLAGRYDGYNFTNEKTFSPRAALVFKPTINTISVSLITAQQILSPPLIFILTFPPSRLGSLMPGFMVQKLLIVLGITPPLVG